MGTTTILIGYGSGADNKVWCFELEVAMVAAKVVVVSTSTVVKNAIYEMRS